MIELSQKGMVGLFRQTCEGLTDPRKKGNNLQYSLVDIWSSGFAVTFFQSPSFLAFQRLMELNRGKNNARSLFKITDIPTDDQIRNVFDVIEQKDLEKIHALFFTLIFAFEQQGHLEEFRIKELGNTLPIAMDGTDTSFSKAISCKGCLVRTHEDGHKDYTHKMIAPMIVSPYKKGIVLSLPPEIILNTDGATKQDCEINGAKRNLLRYGKIYKALRVTFTMDDLYSHQPLCREILGINCHFISVCKEESHKTIYEWIKGICKTYTEEYFENGKRYTAVYVYAEEIPIKDGNDALRVNFFDVIITTATGKPYHNSFITCYPLTEKVLRALTACGRAKWRGENEGHNMLKNHGPSLSHNFGHGETLSSVMVTLILLSFLMHAILFFTDHLYIAILTKLSFSRQTFFRDASALTRYLPFTDFVQLETFMLKGLNNETTQEDLHELMQQGTAQNLSPPVAEKTGK
jgi:hypothetical protein